jgi:opacity protein-like surface antigen
VKRILLVLTVALMLVAMLAVMAAPAFAVGQPNKTCPTPPTVPGFNTSGFSKTADAHYANPTSQGGTSSGNPHVVAQYDVACFGGPRG